MRGRVVRFYCTDLGAIQRTVRAAEAVLATRRVCLFETEDRAPGHTRLLTPVGHSAQRPEIYWYMTS